MRIRHGAFTLGLICLAVAGCTTKSGGTPAPASTSEASTAESTTSSEDGDDLPSHGAPKVEDPLDTTLFQEDPCSTLTAEQAQELTLPTNSGKRESAAGFGCDWSNPDTGGEVSIDFLTRGDTGLSGFYAANEQGKFPYFIPLPAIEGYPAIASDAEDRRSKGICIVNVGVTDQLTFGVALQQSTVNVGTEVDPCDVAARVAGMALQTMKEA
jgi:hypothetical protein